LAGSVAGSTVEASTAGAIVPGLSLAVAGWALALGWKLLSLACGLVCPLDICATEAPPADAACAVMGSDELRRPAENPAMKQTEHKQNRPTTRRASTVGLSVSSRSRPGPADLTAILSIFSGIVHSLVQSHRAARESFPECRLRPGSGFFCSLSIV
jgi:hypothetical protein